MKMNRVSLALGGGAAKGLAHIGVLKGLEADGVEVAAVAGTSMGSVIGALTAQGLGAREIEALFCSVDWVRLGRIMVTSVSGDAFHSMLRETFAGVVIEDLELPFAAVCCDLDTGEKLRLKTGDLAAAVGASSSIPGILPSMTLDGRRLVDGAIVEPVPVTAATELSAAPVLAVSVLRLPGREHRGGSIMTTMPMKVKLPGVVGRIDRWLRRHANDERSGEISARVSRWETVMRSFHIMQHRLATCSRMDAPMIEPEVGRFGWFDFHRVDEIVEAGYQAYGRWAAGSDQRLEI